MTGGNKSSAYNTLRFTWKKKVSACDELSRGAKHLASFLCDTYVNRHTGQCFPKNRTMAEAMGLSERTVQRHLKELEENPEVAGSC